MYKDTLNLPKTEFPMRADAAKREPERLARWEKEDMYGKLRASRAGAPRFVLHFLRRPVGQDLLDAHAAEEGEALAEALLHLVGVHHIGLKRIEHVQAQLDQFGEQLLHLAAGVDEDRLAGP